MKRVALALIALLALTGCTEVGSLADKAQIDLALSSLTTELDELAGITTQYTAELQPDYSYRVDVHATGPQLSTEQLVAAAVLVQKQLGSATFDSTPVSFGLEGPSGTVYSANVFDLAEDDLAGDIAYARAFGEAYGAPTSVFFGTGNTADTYGRVVGALSAAEAPDWDAIRSLPDPSQADRSWQVPGLSFVELPPAQLTDLLDEIGRVTPLGSFDPMVYIDWYGTETFVSFAGSEVDVADPAVSSIWPVTVQIAQLVAAAGLPATTLSVYGFGTSGAVAMVHFGECADVVLPSDTDSVLAAALPIEGAAPGQCLRS